MGLPMEQKLAVQVGEQVAKYSARWSDKIWIWP